VVGVFGAIAGAASVYGNTPIDVVKTRMQVRVYLGYVILAFLNQNTCFFIQLLALVSITRISIITVC